MAKKSTQTVHYTPAAWVIRVFGGVRSVSRKLKKAPSTICRWTKSRESGGCDGRIPSGETQRSVLRIAVAEKMDITADDLIAGRDA